MMQSMESSDKYTLDDLLDWQDEKGNDYVI